MFCPNCQFQNDPSAKFCGKCGSHLNSTPPIQPVSPVQTYSAVPNPSVLVTGTANQIVNLKKQNLALLIILTFITFGIYPAIWFLRNKETFNNLNSSQKLSDNLLYTFLIVSVFGALMTIFQAVYASPPLAVKGLLDMLAGLGNIIYGVIWIILSFKVRAILVDYCQSLNLNLQFSRLWTLIFSCNYLQYKINKLIEINK